MEEKGILLSKMGVSGLAAIMSGHWNRSHLTNKRQVAAQKKKLCFRRRVSVVCPLVLQLWLNNMIYPESLCFVSLTSRNEGSSNEFSS